MTIVPQGRKFDAAPHRAERLVIAGTGLAVLLLVGATSVLWLRHGTAVFFDTLAAGLAMCF
ncbi:hypothetical protein [Aquabacter spiritensis]|uniref:Uncharacterized protein n=1 Tax=Aquabacter spiritensis TaxID=933073 RepID=A0A4V6NZJ4_9HYPH|nr:hypothetical protein [Aquabacter spiritensis]TCT05078.1 hypothetical protein EDC64_105109 [Aquabacter spiritensis]